MQNILNKLKLFVFGPQTQLEFVERALKKHKEKLTYLTSEFDYSDCCPECAYPELIEKIKVVEAHRNGLIQKSKINVF